MKTSILILLASIMSLSSFAGGGYGLTKKCQNDEYSLTIGYAPDGLGSLNPFDLHKDIVILKNKAGGKIKEKYETTYRILDDESFDSVVTVALGICGDHNVRSVANKSESLRFLSCQTFNSNDWVHVVGFEDEVIIFDANSCQKRSPVLF